MSAFDSFPLGQPAFVTNILDRAAHLRGNDEKLLALEEHMKMMIATIKATLVVLFFMHVKQASSLTKTIILAGFFWLVLLMAFTLTDEGSRHLPPPPEGWGASTIAPAAQP